MRKETSVVLNHPVCRTLLYYLSISSVQSLSYVRLFVTPWTTACQASLSITNSRSLLKLMFRVSDAIQPSHPLVSPSLPAFSLSNEYSGLVSFMIDWFDLAVQGTLKSSLQHHSSKASVFSALNFLYNPTLTPMYDYWQNHSFD